MPLLGFLRPASTSHSAKQQHPRRRLVVPVDDTHQSMRALEWAVQHIYRERDELLLLSVVPQVAGPYPAEVLECDAPASTDTVNAWRDECHAHESETEALLSFMQHHATNLGVRQGDVRASPVSASGGASGVGDAIARYVADNRADMVVLGSRGLHGITRHIHNLLGLGSVSYYTMLRAPCPVVIVKSEGERRN